MRIPSTSWLLLIGAASAVTKSAHVFIRDSESTTRQSTLDGIASPDTAKLILSRRLGFSDLYSLSGCAEYSIQQINDFGGPQQQPFSLAKNHDTSRVLLVVEGVPQIDDLLPSSSRDLERFEVKQAPHPKGTDQLIDEFMREAKRDSIENSSGHLHSKALERLSTQIGNKAVTHNGRTIVYVTSMTVRILCPVY